MKYPNLRYGNPLELQHYAQGRPIKDIARQLRRSERSVKDWLDGKNKVPWWVPEMLRLQQSEHLDRLRQMGIYGQRGRLGMVTGDVIAFPARVAHEPEPVAISDPYTLPLFKIG